MGCVEGREQGGLVNPLLTSVGSSEKAVCVDNILSVNSVWPGGSAKDQTFISILAMPGYDMLFTAITSAQSAQVAETGLCPSGDNENIVVVVSHVKALSVLLRLGIRPRSEGQCPWVSCRGLFPG